MVAVIIFGIFMVLMCIGVPVILGLGVSTLAGIIYAGFGESIEQLYVFPLQILEGVDSPALLAIPFFVFAGNLMNVIGVTDKIFRFARAHAGRARPSQRDRITLFWRHHRICGGRLCGHRQSGDTGDARARLPSTVRVRADRRSFCDRPDHVAIGPIADLRIQRVSLG